VAKLAAGLMFLLLPLAVSSQAQNGENREKDGVALAPVHSIVPLPPSKTLSIAELAGKKLFVQRCSVCHLPALPSYSVYGPVLDRKLVASRGEAAIRERIMHGSSRMPGWQYSLKPAEIDEIIGYLQTLNFTQNE
jgi:mono/diheme cytochrome c family protein